MRVHYLAALSIFASGIQGLPLDPNAPDIGQHDADAGISPSIEMANITAIAKPETCIETNRCDWGHICVDGLCKKGCHSNKDCWHKQYCHKKKKQCMFTYIFPPGKECRLVGNGCGWNKSCCSGYCTANFCRRKLEIPKLQSNESLLNEDERDVEDAE